jgi:beta-lactamase regulating signal transducer with metallopeptidase domain
MLFACAIKGALLLAASALGAATLRSAAARHQIWALGVIGALLLPLLSWVMPALPVSIETATTSLLGEPVMVKPRAAGPSWAMLVWAAGSLLLATRFLAGHLAARRILRSAKPDVVLGVDVLRSDRIASPMTIGSRIVLPNLTWSPERLRAVLLHEQGHVRRHDVAYQIAAQLACTLYWWNPLTWLAASRMRVEREHACDDLVLEAGVLPSTYASALIDVTRSNIPDAICMVDSSSSTESRVRRILDEHTPRRSRRITRFAIGALAAGCTLLLSTSGAATRAKVSTLTVGAPFRNDGYVSGAPTMHGTIDLSLVAAEVQRRLPDLEACYQRRLEANAALAGIVVIHWVISPTGVVVEQCITKDTVGDQELTECVNKLVSDGSFPAPSGGAVDVAFPFVFDH